MIYRSESGAVRLALAGDLMPSRRLDVFDEPQYLALRDLLRSADVAFANLETTVRRPGEGAPIFTKGTPMSTPPELLRDLMWLGVDVVACANNHATDYGVEGMLASMGHLRHAGLPAAGQGANLAEAVAPVYVDSPGGRVAVVAATAFFPPSSRASDQRSDSAGRPGVAPIGFSTRYVVDRPAYEQLRRLDDELGFKAERLRQKGQFYSAGEIGADEAGRLTLLGSDFLLGEGFQRVTQANSADVERVLRSVREARRQADWVIFSFHYHEFGPSGAREARSLTQLREPARFVVEVARLAVEAGADVVAGHGPHVTLGVEIYQGKPILYSLGNFVFQNETVATVPAESFSRFGLGAEATPADFFDARTDRDTRGFPASAEFWQSFVANCEFTRAGLSSVELQPIDLGHGRPRGQRGRPVLAGAGVADNILRRLEDLSEPWGTRFKRVGHRAFVELP